MKVSKVYSQIGKSTFFKLRNKNDSELNINQSIKKQFNLMRVNDNKNYPSFFNYMGKKYIINLYKQKKRN
jgi:methionyl-tRNA formyltransferase